MHRRHFLATAASAALSPAAHAAGADWSEDIAILRRTYTLLHPGLYRYATPAQVARRFDALERAFFEGPPLPQAYLTLSRFLATVRCGHTYANFYNQRASVTAALFEGRTRLPFHFRLLGGRMVVVANHSSDARLAPGAEVLSIDGRSPRAIVRALLPYVRADGGNDAKRLALLEVRGRAGFETFDIFHPLVFPMRGGEFALSVRPPGGGSIQRLEVAAIDLAARRAAMVQPGRDAPRWTFSMRPGVGVLTMPDWRAYDSTWNWQGFLDDAFAQLANARALIVDLRGNEGGNDCGDEIIARCVDRDIRRGGYERRVRYRTTPKELDPYLVTWDDSFRRLGSEAEFVGDGFYRLPDRESDLIRPKGPRFRGELILLTDAHMSSATFHFAQAVQDMRLGKLVGAPTGGNRRGTNGGGFFFLRLPKSGLEADVPLIGEFPTTPQPDAGLLPDVAVTETVADIAAGRDRVLETALALAPS